VVSGGPAADVALAKERRNQDPGVLDDLLDSGKSERDGDIETTPDAP
jgi:hypothetical protein